MQLDHLLQRPKAVGEGGGELAKQLVGRTYDVARPGVVAIYLDGAPKPGVGPQDVALTIIGAVYANGYVKNKVMEFVGPGVASLPIKYRNGIDVMTTETTCWSSIWVTDEKTKDYFTVHGRPEAVQSVYAALTAAGVANDPAATVIGSTIYANKPGDGSAREQAASCQRVLGAAANLAKEYATKRYRSNCINWGMAPFLVKDADAFALGDYVFVPGLRKAIMENTPEFTVYTVKADGTVKPFSVSLGQLTPDERQIIIDGCLINYYRNH